MAAFDFSAFDRATDPIFRLLTPQQTRAIIELRGDEQLAQRIEELAIKCNEGELTGEERAEYEAYASANRFIALVQAKARRLMHEASGSLGDSESIDSEEAAAVARLRAKTPPNSVLLGLVHRATVPPEIEDIQEERPW